MSAPPLKRERHNFAALVPFFVIVTVFYAAIVFMRSQLHKQSVILGFPPLELFDSSGPISVTSQCPFFVKVVRIFDDRGQALVALHPRLHQIFHLFGQGKHYERR